MTTEAIDSPLRILFSRRQIFVGDFSAGLRYRDAEKSDRREFNRLRAILNRLPGAVLATVDSVVLYEEMPRSQRCINNLAEGLDALHDAIEATHR